MTQLAAIVDLPFSLRRCVATLVILAAFSLITLSVAPAVASDDGATAASTPATDQAAESAESDSSGAATPGAAVSGEELERERLLRALIPLALLVSLVMVFLALELRRRRREQDEDDAPSTHPNPRPTRPSTRSGSSLEPSLARQAAASGELEVVTSDSVSLAPHLFADSAVVECPDCNREFDAMLSTCPFDGTELEAVERAQRQRQPADTLDTSTTQMSCQTCQRSYEMGTRFCPFDGDTLVSFFNDDAPVRTGQLMSCPECGETYDGDAAFCPEDQTRLVATDETQDGEERYLSLVPMMVCTVCASEYPVGQQECPECEHPLSYMHGRRTAGLEIVTGDDLHNICPDCGSRYPSDLSFCCTDGHRLVAVN